MKGKIVFDETTQEHIDEGRIKMEKSYDEDGNEIVVLTFNNGHKMVFDGKTLVQEIENNNIQEGGEFWHEPEVIEKTEIN